MGACGSVGETASGSGRDCHHRFLTTFRLATVSRALPGIIDET